jgi:hypothetical protein
MDSKYYVSYEAARLLKEKGYNEVVESYYDTLGELNEVRSIFQNSVADNSFLHRFGDYYAAPTKAEAIDWLEDKGLVIEVFSARIGENRKWCYSIINTKTDITIETPYKFSTRLEAEEAAIIKALELL